MEFSHKALDRLWNEIFRDPPRKLPKTCSRAKVTKKRPEEAKSNEEEMA